MSLVLFLEELEPLVDFRLILSSLLTCLVLLIVKTDEVLACYVKAIEVVDSIFGTVDVFVDDEASTFGF